MSGCYSFYLVSKWLLLYVLWSANLWRGFLGQRAMESVVFVGKYEGCLSEKKKTVRKTLYGTIRKYL